MTGVGEYLADLADRFGRGWNRFWFEPSDPLTLCVLRILVGLLALWFHFSFTFNLLEWFGPAGLLSLDATRDLVTGFRPSPLYLTDRSAMLWAMHGLGFAVLLALTIGLFTRTSAILSLLVVLSYVNRAALVTGPFEPVLTMLLLYLCIGPAGAYLSVDALLRKRRTTRPSGKTIGAVENHGCCKSSSTTVAIRLMQVHLAAFYLLAGLTMLRSDTWWGGEAAWWLAAHVESRLVDLTPLAVGANDNGPGFFFNAWTHAIVLFNLAFPLLVWNRLARPLLLAAAVLYWIPLALVTGLVSYCAIMLAANLAFVAPETVCHVGDRLIRRANQTAKVEIRVTK